MKSGDPWQEEEVLIRVDRRDIGYLQATLDSYEGLAVMRTLHPDRGIVRVYFPALFCSEVQSLLLSLQTELEFEFMDS
jgi:hypothetical protein